MQFVYFLLAGKKHISINEYRERDENVLLAVAFPDYPRYHSLAKKITWMKPVANFSYYWVTEDGRVDIE